MHVALLHALRVTTDDADLGHRRHFEGSQENPLEIAVTMR